MTSTSEKSNILKFRKRKQLNIGIIIFGIIFIYLIATIFMYITAPRTAVYEVRQGSILKDYAYTGLALRDEMVVKAEDSGYINYYAQESSKVRVGSNIYILSNQKLNFTPTGAEELKITSHVESAIISEIQKYNKNFQQYYFEETYALKNSIEEQLGDLSSTSKANQINALVNENNSSVSIFKTTEDGIIVFEVDGLENLTTETVEFKHLDRTDYNSNRPENNSKIKSGDAVYKIITDDKWNLMIELTEETAQTLAEKKYVKVKFAKDNQEIWATIRIEEKQNRYLACLSFQDAMVRYATDRYLDIELILEDETGLKIPKTAETTKEFYVVPRSYITQGGNSSKDSVLLQTTDESGKSVTILKEVTVYYEEDELVYLETSAFESGQVLRMPDSNDTYVLSEKKTLKGVYCINKGYAVFKQIHILCESDSYYIVEEGNAYGLSNYDHIALDSTNISENDVVF